MMEKLVPYHGSPSRHTSWREWAERSAEHVDAPTVEHPEEKDETSEDSE